MPVACDDQWLQLLLVIDAQLVSPVLLTTLQRLSSLLLVHTNIMGRQEEGVGEPMRGPDCRERAAEPGNNPDVLWPLHCSELSTCYRDDTF